MTSKEFRELYCKEENSVGNYKYRFVCSDCGGTRDCAPADMYKTYSIYGRFLCSKCSIHLAREKSRETMGPEGIHASHMKRSETLGPEGRKAVSHKMYENMSYEKRLEKKRKRDESIGHEGLHRISKKASSKRIKTMYPNMSDLEYPDWFINALAYEDDKELARTKNLDLYEKLVFICPKCGEEFERTGYNVIRVTDMEPTHPIHEELWCQHCTNTSPSSICETKLLEELKKTYSVYKESRFFPHVDGSRGAYEGDIVCKDGKWVVEVDGEYWHTEGPNGYHSYGYHHDKDMAIEAKGYRVLHLSAEWVDEDLERAVCYVNYWVSHSLPSVSSKFDTTK